MDPTSIMHWMSDLDASSVDGKESCLSSCAASAVVEAVGDPCPSDGKKTYIVLREKIDLDAAKRLLCSAPMLALQASNVSVWRTYSDLIGLATMLGGEIPVRYYYDEVDGIGGFGRFKAVVDVAGCRHLLPYVRMMREVRAHFASKHYWDVDFVNCQPTILAQVLEARGIACPLLTRYVANRDACLSDVMAATGVSREAAKKLFIRLVCFGRAEMWVAEMVAAGMYDMTSSLPSWIHDLQTELVESCSMLLDSAELAPFVSHCKTVHTNNRMGTIVSLFLQTQERLCLEALFTAIDKDGRSIGGLINDGLHVEKDSPDAPMLAASTLLSWKRAVARKTGYDLEVSVKPFECNPAWLATDVEMQRSSTENALNDMMTYEEMRAAWEKNVCKILHPGIFVRVFQSGVQEYSKHNLSNAFEHLHYSKLTQTKRRGNAGEDMARKKYPFLKTWLKDPQMRTFQRMEVYPPPLQCPPDEFNLWTPFDVELYKPTKPVDVNSDGVKAIVQHLHILLGGKDAYTKYALDWEAQMYQQPGKKTGVAILIKGEEGVGKTFWTAVHKGMMGSDKFLETSKPSNVLYGHFTSARRNKVLICINEANGKDNHANNDVLKDMITSETFVCEAKGVDAVMLRAYDRFIFTTNNDNPVSLGPDSRRFVVFDASSKLKGNTEYFKRLADVVADPHVRREYYEFLMARDISGVDWLNDRPRTDGMLRLIANNTPLEYRFVADLLSKARVDRKVDVRMQCDKLFAGFQDWLSANSIFRYETNQVKFGLKMSKLIATDKNASGVRGVTKLKMQMGNVYKFEPAVVLAELVAKGWIEGEDAL